MSYHHLWWCLLQNIIPLYRPNQCFRFRTKIPSFTVIWRFLHWFSPLFRVIFNQLEEISERLLIQILEESGDAHFLDILLCIISWRKYRGFGRGGAPSVYPCVCLSECLSVCVSECLGVEIVSVYRMNRLTSLTLQKDTRALEMMVIRWLDVRPNFELSIACVVVWGPLREVYVVL